MRIATALASLALLLGPAAVAAGQGPVLAAAPVPPAATADYEAGHRAQAQQHDFPLAVTLLDRAIAAAPGFAQAYAERGMIYYQMGKLAEAGRDLSRAIDLDLPEAMARPVFAVLGIVYRRTNRPDDAVRVYTAYLKRHENWDILSQRGEAYQLGKDYARARADFARALDLSPSNPRVVQSVAVLDLQAGAWASAVADSAVLLAIRPDDSDAIRLHETALQKAREQKAALDAPATVDSGSARDAYARAIDRLRRGEVQADYAALRRERLGRAGFHAVPWLSSGAAGAALSGGDPKSALMLAEGRLADDYLDIGAQEIACLALRALNRPVEASRHLAVAGGLIRSILASGDGTSQAAAWRVTSVDEEYAVLSVKRLNRTRQTLVDVPGHHFDRLDVKDQQGAASSLWFNIDAFFGSRF